MRALSAATPPCTSATTRPTRTRFRVDGVIGVRVGECEGSAAAYCVADQEEIDDLLQHLVEARPHAQRRPEAAPRARGRTTG